MKWWHRLRGHTIRHITDPVDPDEEISKMISAFVRLHERGYFQYYDLCSCGKRWTTWE